MATPSWQISGQYYETCSCDLTCPCIVRQMAVSPTKGSCMFAMAFQIERGSYGALSLDGLGFIVLGFTPEAMGKGNWSVGTRPRIVFALARASNGALHALGLTWKDTSGRRNNGQYAPFSWRNA